MRPGRTGFMYVQDRRTGQVLSADPYAFVNSARGVDLSTGRLIPVPEKAPRMGRVTRMICPAAPGGKDWNPSAFSPRTGLIYVPHINLCMDHGAMEANYISGTPFLGAETRMYAGPGGHRGEFTAWDPIGRRVAWKIKEDLPVWSGARDRYGAAESGALEGPTGEAPVGDRRGACPTRSRSPGRFGRV